MNKRTNQPVFYEASHTEPVWRTRSNYIIAADISESQDKVEREQLWVRKVTDYQFEICCIPFFVYDVALGDVVETDKNYFITRVVKSSGHYVFRVWFGDCSDPACRDDVSNLMKSLGCELEWSSKNLLAIDAPAEDVATKVADCLQKQHALGRLKYETGKTR